MARLAPTVLVVLLLAGTAGAFAITERLKLVRSPITDTRIRHKVFSPVCHCDKEQATLSFSLREKDSLTVAIIDADGDVIRTLAEGEPTAAGDVAVSWDGRDDSGDVVPEGTYKPRVHLADARNTTVLPNPIRVDVTPPRVLSFRVAPRMFSPDGDGRNDKAKVFYRMSERAHALVFLGDRRVVRGRSSQPSGKVDWGGIVDRRPLRAGLYALGIAAEDVAGNVGSRTETPVRIRYVELARDVIRARAGFRFGIRILTDAETITWRFAGGRGQAKRGLLVLRAPRKPGRYTLFVEANGHASRARVIVGPRRVG